MNGEQFLLPDPEKLKILYCGDSSSCVRRRCAGEGTSEISGLIMFQEWKALALETIEQVTAPFLSSVLLWALQVLIREVTLDYFFSFFFYLGFVVVVGWLADGF